MTREYVSLAVWKSIVCFLNFYFVIRVCFWEGVGPPAVELGVLMHKNCMIKPYDSGIVSKTSTCKSQVQPPEKLFL